MCWIRVLLVSISPVRIEGIRFHTFTPVLPLVVCLASIHWVSYLSNSLVIYAFLIILLCFGFSHWFCIVCVISIVACTQTLFYFSSRSFRKHWRARARSERARTSVDREKGEINFLFSSSPTPTPLRWRSINPLRFIFYNARSTDFEEKIECLWIDYLDRQKYKIKGGPWPSSGFQYTHVLTHV